MTYISLLSDFTLNSSYSKLNGNREKMVETGVVQA